MPPRVPSINQVSVAATGIQHLHLLSTAMDPDIWGFSVIVELDPEINIWDFDRSVRERLQRSWPELRTEVLVPWEHRLVLAIALRANERQLGDILRFAADLVECVDQPLDH